tara:strand:- start:57 stop:218 length:162 start_codon:yes stop_codon:yes gene_type:complete
MVSIPFQVDIDVACRLSVYAQFNEAVAFPIVLIHRKRGFACLDCMGIFSKSNI